MPEKDYPIKVSTGDHHSCMLSKGGRLKCWGRADDGVSGLASGYLGEDIGDDSGEVRAISFLYNHSVLDVASGSTHSCAIIKDDPNNRIDCWGRNGSNQLGLGHTNHIGDQVGEFRDTQVNKSPSYDHDTFGNPVSIHARYYTTCVLTDTQRLVCWGQNNKGQLGRNSGDNHGVPGLVELKDSNGDYVNITKVIVGGRHVCAVSDLNEVFCWGSNITSNTNGNEPESWDTVQMQLMILEMVLVLISLK